MRSLLLYTFLLILPYSFAQRDTIADNLTWPLGLEAYGNYLYFADAQDSAIYRLDKTIPNPVPELVVDNLGDPHFLAINGSELFYTEYNVFGNGTISKIDISQPSPTPMLVLGGLTTAEGLFMNGNELYYTEFNSGTLSKIDVTQPSPTPTQIVSGLTNPSGVYIVGNFAYVSELTAGQISKIDITQPSPTPVAVLTGLSSPIGGMELIGDRLYFSQYSTDEVSYFNVSSPTELLFDTNLNGAEILYDGVDLYITDFVAGMILKYTDPFAGIPEMTLMELNIYPNPVVDKIELVGLSQEIEFNIVNSLGDIVITGRSKDMRIDVSEILPGLYFILSEGYEPMQFVKQ